MQVTAYDLFEDFGYVDVVCLDSITVKVRPDACGALKKEENKQSEDREVDLQQKFILLLPRQICNKFFIIKRRGK